MNIIEIVGTDDLQDARWRPFKAAATRLRVTLLEYIEHRMNGRKWCPSHHEWEPEERFGHEPSRPDHLGSQCLLAIRVSHRAAYASRAHFPQELSR